MTTAIRHDAATVLARSEASVTSEGFSYGIQADLFTAQVTLDGIDFDYLFQGDWFVGGTSVALGRARRMGVNNFRATTADGTVVADGVSRREAHIAVYLASRG